MPLMHCSEHVGIMSPDLVRAEPIVAQLPPGVKAQSHTCSGCLPGVPVVHVSPQPIEEASQSMWTSC